MINLLKTFQKEFPDIWISEMKKIFIVNNNQEMTDLANRMCAAEITKPLSIEVSVYKRNRTRAQEKLFHMHMNEIAKHYGETQGDYHSPKVWKVYYKEKFLTMTESEIKDKTVFATQDTSDLKVNEYSDLIEKVIADAAQELGCQVTVPQDLFNEAMGHKKAPTTNPQ